jgi:AcrR family transcriptional regulator
LAGQPAKVRTLKAPAERQAELIDVAQALFLTRGYERTTINDVINATGLSKGAFYHHFRAKEDLLEAIAARFARESLAFVHALQADSGLDAVQRINRLLALGREWKREHIGELKRIFETLLKPENALLYQRIVDATFEVLAPALAGMIAQGQAEGVVAPGDPRAAADTILWMHYGRRAIVIEAMSLAESHLDAAMRRLVERVRAEETIVDRILGLPPGSIAILGPPEMVADMMRAWRDASVSA